MIKPSLDNKKIKQSLSLKKPYILIITGPTASGKTALSLQLSNLIEAEIINVDVGQFYKPLNIGTAKPDWRNQKITHHCFDIIDLPKDLSVFEFNKIVLDKINYIWSKNKIPILVGGSLFYIKSLFFPPKALPGNTTQIDFEQSGKDVNLKNLWEELNKIDPKRAKVLHKNDIYRIQRALDIWRKTGIKPSEYEPKFNPMFNARILFIEPDKETLVIRINERTSKMINRGWIEETESLIGTTLVARAKWELFLKKKKLIGYPEIIDWIKSGKQPALINDLIKIIQTKTKQYAKRQLTFWKSFKKILEKSNEASIKVSVLNNLDKKTLLAVQQEIKNDLKNLYS